ncbi:GHKL domain-containing protein [bacterium]|nr:GHKL domain-containing protein [bacterium]
MLNSITWLFETDLWPPRWRCGEWSDSLGWMHIISDCFVFSAYVAIPLVLAYFVLKRKDMVFPRIFWLFAAFIFACGTTHLVEAIIFWQPIYRFAGLLKFLTAVVSWLTVAALIRIVPQALELPGLATVNERLESEVQERRIAQQKYEAANEALLSRNDELQQFVYTVSHDLKSPLVTARGFIGVLKEDVESQDFDRIANSVNRIEASTERMQELIGDLLQLSRVGSIRYEPEWINPAGLLMHLRDSVSEPGAEHQIEIKMPLPQVFADRVRLNEVFQNLLSNAVKYGCPTPDSRVRVSATDDSNGVTFRIADSGPGIAPELQARAFLPFERLHSGGDGTGIGLSIAKRIIENHGGRIWIESPPEGGTVFVFHLPHPEKRD